MRGGPDRVWGGLSEPRRERLIWKGFEEDGPVQMALLGLLAAHPVTARRRPVACGWAAHERGFTGGGRIRGFWRRARRRVAGGVGSVEPEPVESSTRGARGIAHSWATRPELGGPRGQETPDTCSAAGSTGGGVAASVAW